MLCMYHIFTFYSPFEGYSAYIQFLAIVNKMTMNGSDPISENSGVENFGLMLRNVELSCVMCF